MLIWLPVETCRPPTGALNSFIKRWQHMIQVSCSVCILCPNAQPGPFPVGSVSSSSFLHSGRFSHYSCPTFHQAHRRRSKVRHKVFTNFLDTEQIHPNPLRHCVSAAETTPEHLKPWLRLSDVDLSGLFHLYMTFLLIVTTEPARFFTGISNRCRARRRQLIEAFRPTTVRVYRRLLLD